MMQNMYTAMGISPEVYEYGEQTLVSLKDRFDEIDKTAEYNQLKVLKAMQDCRVSEACLLGTTGYGYNDIGRDTLEAVYASLFHTEAALVRPQITCGTHALALALMSNLRPGDELLSPVGKPYDTLEEVIGIRESRGSLKEYGISYRQVDLKEDGSFDWEGIRNAIHPNTKLATIQRSKGYQTRPTLSVEQIGELIAFLKSIKPDIICMVDNCYGEFTQTIEPTDVGADMCVGSLIKNPGGGLAPIGGYIVGKKDCVENAAFRLTSPGLGREVGASLQVLPSFYQGLFLAPTVTAGALKGAIFAANLYEALGFKVLDMNEVDSIGVYIDGADEIDGHFAMIKGGGGALTREKIVARISRRFVCIADASKKVDVLGRFPLPVEVIPMAAREIKRRLEALGADVKLRDFVTDNGCSILDAAGLEIRDPQGLETEINSWPGVVTVGLFAARGADVLLLGTSEGVKTFKRG